MRARSTSPLIGIAAAAALLIAGALLLSSFLRYPFPTPFQPTISSDEIKTALVHYATTQETPQQSRQEITLTLNVLRRRSPCNFLVFGLGLDSPMWSALNSGGTTVFLEETQQWINKVVGANKHLHALHVNYHTRLDDADHLMQTYKSVPECMMPNAKVKGNEECRLALSELPEEVLSKEWDVIMVDAPRGYFAAAPGRMAAIWTAGVMARTRKQPGETDVFVHDVDRKVEKAFAKEFLCEKFRVEATGRLWHFRIPASNGTEKSFC